LKGEVNKGTIYEIH